MVALRYPAVPLIDPDLVVPPTTEVPNPVVTPPLFLVVPRLALAPPDPTTIV
jgi:hypothetical protein